MAEKVASLFVDIGADTSDLQKGLAQTKAGLKNTSKELTTFGGGIKETAKQMATWAIAGGAIYKVAGGIADFFKSSVNDTMDYAKAVRDVARYTGTSAEESSKFLQIADDLQIETNTLKVGFRNLNQEGIQPNIENIKDLAAQYQALKSPVDKAQFAMKMFGARSGMELAKVLELTTEQIDEMAQSAEDLGLVLDSKAIQATEDYRLAVDELNDAWKGLLTTTGMKVIPMLSDLAEGGSDFVTAFSLAQKAIENGKYSVIDFFATWMTMSSQAEIDQYIDDLREAAGTLADTFIDDRRESILAAQGIEEFGEVTRTTQKILDPTSVALWDMAGAFNANAAAVGLLKGTLDDFGKDVADQQQALLNYKIVTEGITEAELDSALAKIDNLRRLEDLTKALDDGRISEGEFWKVMADGQITVTELNNVLGYTPGILTELQKATGISEKAWAEYAKETVASASAANGELVTTKSLIAGITAAWAGVPRDVRTKYTVEFVYIGERITYGDGKKLAPGIPKQEGGPVWQGAPYIVGERGPELFVPNTSGRIIPNKQLEHGGMGGGDTINIYNNSAGAAALTMALLQQSHRARLGRSMGG